MARKRASVNAESSQIALGTDILDRILDSENLPEDQRAIIETPLAQIEPNPFQTRRHFDKTALNELSKSIKSQGFYGYLLARSVGDVYQIAYGERRFRASKLAGLNAIPLVIREFTDEQMMEVAITENVIREDLNPMEEAEAYKHLADAGYSLSRMSNRVGKSKGHISTLLSLLKLPDVAEALRQERVGLWAAREIAKVGSSEARHHLVNRTAQGEFNRDALKAAVRLAIEETEYDLVPSIVVKGDNGEEILISRSEAEALGTEDIGSSAQSDGLRALQVYDPIPNLRASLSRLEKIRADRFDDIESFSRGDVIALLREIASRSTHLLNLLEDPWEPPAKK